MTNLVISLQYLRAEINFPLTTVKALLLVPERFRGLQARRARRRIPAGQQANQPANYRSDEWRHGVEHGAPDLIPGHADYDQHAQAAANDPADDSQRSAREQKPVDPPRPAQNGDAIKIDFVGSVDGKEFPGGTAEDYTLELGSGSFIPGFEDQLVGAEVGKTVDVKVTFPAEYGSAELAGKDAVFKCTIKEIREFVEKPADDELAKKNNFENLDAMRKAVAERIGQDYAQVSRTMIKRQLLDKLADTHKFDVPAGLVDGEFNAIWQRIEEAKKSGQKVDDDEEKMRKEYREIAERRVRLGLLLADVGRSNSIDVTPEELNQAVMREAMRYPGQERQVLEFYSKNAELKERLRAPIFEEKTVDFILELAKVSEKSVTPEELLKAAREAEEAEDEESSKEEPAKQDGPKE